MHSEQKVVEEELSLSSLIVQPGQQHERLDVLLRNFYKTASRTYFQKLIQDGLVVVNGQPVKKSYKLEVDDEIEVQFVATKELEVLPEDIPLEVIYEDEHMLAINKPPGMVVHPGYGNWTGTFVNALLFYCKNLEKDDSLRPGIVHRLDKETSGVLLAAKTYDMHKKLSVLFSSRAISKKYIAVCFGRPKDGKISAPIGRHPIHRKQMAVLAEGGKDATTIIQVHGTNEKYSVLEITLETGRTHQIRVHLKHIGHPLVGDTLYGRQGDVQNLHATRQLLHAESLSFIHPSTNKPLVLKAKLPDDMQKICEKICGH
jgi:23S rRNA pseudouridine1911/1915/1917 synthase